MIVVNENKDCNITKTFFPWSVFYTRNAFSQICGIYLSLQTSEQNIKMSAVCENKLTHYHSAVMC